VKDLLLLLGAAVLLGTAANALSPRGLSWTRPLGRGVTDQVAAAGLVPVDLAAVRSLLQDRSTVFVDARRREQYAIGRLPGALNTPWNEVEGTTLRLPQGKNYVLYCDNEFCESALRLGEHLKKEGHRNIAVFVDGYEAWWNAGGSVDQD
jgi:ArsR family transcriptional regulator